MAAGRAPARRSGRGYMAQHGVWDRPGKDACIKACVKAAVPALAFQYRHCSPPCCAYVSLTTWCVLGEYENREMPVSHPRSRVDTGWTAATAVLLAYTAVHKRLPVLLQCLALDCVHIAANVQMRWMCAVTRSKGRLSQCCETSAPGGGMMLLREPDKDACARVCVRQSRDTAC